MQPEKKFSPTPEMLSAAETVFKAMAVVQTISPIVLAYETAILTEGQWRIKPDFAKRLGDKVILDPKDSYLMSEEDFAAYWAKCKQARDQAKLPVKDDEFCPKLVAENELRKAQRALVDSMETETGTSADRLLNGGLGIYDRYLELTLQLLGPFMPKKLQFRPVGQQG